MITTAATTAALISPTKIINMSSKNHSSFQTNDRVRVFAGDLEGKKGLFKGMVSSNTARVLFDGEGAESVVAVRILEKLIELRLEDYQSLLSDLDEWRYQMRDLRLRVKAIAPEHDPTETDEIQNLF